MTLDSLHEKIQSLVGPSDAASLLHFWSILSPLEKSSLAEQVMALDKNVLRQQKELFEKRDQVHRQQKPLECLIECLIPYNEFHLSGSNNDWMQRGKELVQQGKTGTILLAGGQGSRLGFDQPKGCYPISPGDGKSLFQLVAEKIVAASKQAGRPLRLAVLTSRENDEKVRSFFAMNLNFGLSEGQLFFFTQETLPFLDERGTLFLETPSQIAKGANGNGQVFQHFIQSGLATEWLRQGVEFVQVIPVDNPLANPCDDELLGYHISQHLEISLRCIEKTHPAEKIGLLVKSKGHLRVVEYNELQEEDQTARMGNGQLRYRCGNSGILCFSLNFITQNEHLLNQLPLHKSLKTIRSAVESTQIHAWKFESFIFDALCFAKNVGALLSDRALCFAPLKNAFGEHSPEAVRLALQPRKLF